MEKVTQIRFKACLQLVRNNHGNFQMPDECPNELHFTKPIMIGVEFTGQVERPQFGTTADEPIW